MAQVLICCQFCGRRYRVEPDKNGMLARCVYCDNYCWIATSEPALPGEAIMLEEEVEPRFNFFADGVATLAANTRDLFRMAGQPFVREKVIEFISDLPRTREDVSSNLWTGTHSHRLMRMASDNDRELGRLPDLARVIRYFLEYLPNRSPSALDMLLGAFAGVLSVEFDAPESFIPSIPDPAPEPAQPGTLVERLRAAIQVLRHGLPAPRVELQPIAERRTSTLDD